MEVEKVEKGGEEKSGEEEVEKGDSGRCGGGERRRAGEEETRSRYCGRRRIGGCLEEGDEEGEHVVEAEKRRLREEDSF